MELIQIVIFGFLAALVMGLSCLKRTLKRSAVYTKQHVR